MLIQDFFEPQSRREAQSFFIYFLRFLGDSAVRKKNEKQKQNENE
jgi:hypothetical protein